MTKLKLVKIGIPTSGLFFEVQCKATSIATCCIESFSKIHIGTIFKGIANAGCRLWSTFIYLENNFLQ